MNALKSALVVGGVVAAPAALYLLAGQPEDVTENTASGLVIPQLSARAYEGKAHFATACGACHGIYGEGTDRGPSLLHRLYAPAELSDDGIRQAIRYGARARHWPFGDMPAVAGIERGSEDAIIGFLRALQRANGIY